MKVKRKDCILRKTRRLSPYPSLIYKLNLYKFIVSSGHIIIDGQEVFVYDFVVFKRGKFEKSCLGNSPHFYEWFNKKEQRIISDMVEIYDSILVMNTLIAN